MGNRLSHKEGLVDPFSSPFPLLSSPSLPFPSITATPRPWCSFVSQQWSRCGRSQPCLSFDSSAPRPPFFSPTDRSCSQRVSGHFFFVFCSFSLLLATGLCRETKFGALKRDLLRFRQLAFCCGRLARSQGERPVPPRIEAIF